MASPLPFSKYKLPNIRLPSSNEDVFFSYVSMGAYHLPE